MLIFVSCFYKLSELQEAVWIHSKPNKNSISELDPVYFKKKLKCYCYVGVGSCRTPVYHEGCKPHVGQFTVGSLALFSCE